MRLIALTLSALVRVACVGDSVTEGVSESSYPSKLSLMLGNKYQVFNFGAGGRAISKKADFSYWTMPHFIMAKRYLPHIVVMNFGLNDTKPWNWSGKASFKRDYIDIIRQFRKLRSKPRILICIPTPLILDERFGLTKSTLEKEIIPTVKQIAKSQKVELINLHKLFISKPELQPDYIHPNEQGMKLIAKEVYNNIIRRA